MLRRACANSVWDSKHPVSREPALSACSSAFHSVFCLMGGSNCAVVGCGCCSSCNKGVTFNTFPKSGKNNETDEWRRRLINAVSRADKSFNPDRALICSRHFEDSCFVPHGKPCLLYSHNLCVKHM